MIGLVFGIIEAIFVITAMTSLHYYRKFGRERKLRTVPGAFFDLSMLCIVFFPAFFWLIYATVSGSLDFLSGMALMCTVAILAVVCLFFDIKTLVRNHKINKRVADERGRERLR